jgi:hypothetical protein
MKFRANQAYHTHGEWVLVLFHLMIHLSLLSMPLYTLQTWSYGVDNDADISQFLLTFDTNPIILNRVKETLRADPLVVRWTVLKKGSAMWVFSSFYFPLTLLWMSSLGPWWWSRLLTHIARTLYLMLNHLLCGLDHLMTYNIEWFRICTWHLYNIPTASSMHCIIAQTAFDQKQSNFPTDLEYVY